MKKQVNPYSRHAPLKGEVICMVEIKANEGKKLVREVAGIHYLRIPIKTKIIGPNDQLNEVLDHYAQPLLVPGDILFIAEKVIACMQQRLVKVTDVHPRKLAHFLSRFVYKNPADLADPGLALPETMEMVMREVGSIRILFATAASVVGKLFGKRGWFYLIAGPLARDIDGPTSYVIPPYTNYIILGPHKPQNVAKNASKYLNHDVAIVDVNDLGGNVLANTSDLLADDLIVEILKDNPLGQSNEQTPLGIIRKQEVLCEKV